MKKILSRLFAGILVALCLMLAVGFFVPSQPAGNEQLAPPPQLFTEAGLNGDFFSHAAQWFNDHFFGRQTLISMQNYLDAHLLGEEELGQVIAGKDGWLFYSSTKPDFMGQTAKDADLLDMANNLALMQQYCQSKESKFVFAIAPNKNTLYADKMPYAGKNPGANAQKLMSLLQEKGVNTADLFGALSGQKEILYFPHDSHWNSKGAALGADCINQALGVESRYFAGDFSKKAPYRGDLYDMLYPGFTDTQTDSLYGGKLNFSYATAAQKPDSITLLTKSDKPGSLLCYRDSFGNLLYPYLADSYGDCRFSRGVSYDLTGEFDYVAIELVERNLSYLITYLPVMPAPKASAEKTESVGSVSLQVQSGDMQKVTGTLPVQKDAGTPVYLFTENGCYQAFLLKDNGFGGYLPEAPTAVGYYTNGIFQTYTAK